MDRTKTAIDRSGGGSDNLLPQPRCPRTQNPGNRSSVGQFWGFWRTVSPDLGVGLLFFLGLSESRKQNGSLP